MQPVDRPGYFRGVIVEYGLKESKDGAVGIGVRAELHEFFDEEGNWVNVRDYQWEVSSDLYIISKIGEPMDFQIKPIVQHCGWDGRIESIANNEWQPTQCQFNIKEEIYKGKPYRKIAFINDYDRAPGANLSNVDAEKAKAIAARFGGQLRALTAGLNRNGSKPAGRPAPPPPPRSMPQVASGPIDPPPPSGEDIPF